MAISEVAHQYFAPQKDTPDVRNREHHLIFVPRESRALSPKLREQPTSAMNHHRPSRIPTDDAPQYVRLFALFHVVSTLTDPSRDTSQRQLGRHQLQLDDLNGIAELFSS